MLLRKFPLCLERRSSSLSFYRWFHLFYLLALFHLSSLFNPLLPFRAFSCGYFLSSLICLLLVPTGSIYLCFFLSLTFLLHLVLWVFLSLLLAIYLLLTLTGSSYNCPCLPFIRSHFISLHSFFLYLVAFILCWLLLLSHTLCPSPSFSFLILSLLVFSSVYLSNTRMVSALCSSSLVVPHATVSWLLLTLPT